MLRLHARRDAYGHAHAHAHGNEDEDEDEDVYVLAEMGRSELW